MTEVAQLSPMFARSAPQLEEAMDLRLVRGERNAVWAFGKLRRHAFPDQRIVEIAHL